MTLPKITKQNILTALKYIDDNGVPSVNKSKGYALVVNGKEYPPKYVIATADYLAGGRVSPTTEDFSSFEARRYLIKEGFQIVSLK